MTVENEKWMRYVLSLARKGWGKTNPNPLVGCALVKDNQLVAEGFHAALGQHHAERAAIDEANKKGINLEGVTLYVNLEPCVHHGRTPPCAQYMIDSGIKSVVIAMSDPNPLMAGKGIAMLREAGINVITGVLETEAVKLNEIFIKYITTGLPFILMKTAITIDGKIASNRGDSRWISGEASRSVVHHWRQRMSGIMVGANTVLIDNPSLTTRLSETESINPTRIIIDGHARLSLDQKVFRKDEPSNVILATTSSLDQRKKDEFEAAGVEIVCLENDQGQVDLHALCSCLGQKGLDSIMLEGGGRLNEAFLRAGLIDKIMLFMAPKIMGGSQSVSCFFGEGIEKMSDAVRVSDMTVAACGEDWLIQGYPVYGED